MATDLRKVEYKDGTLTYDNDMSMGALRKLMSAGREGDLELMIEAYTGIIASWPYKGDPSDPEAWDSIKRSEFMALNEALMEDLQEQGEV